MAGILGLLVTLGAVSFASDTPVKVTLIDARGHTSELKANSSHWWKNTVPPELWVDFSLPSPYLLKKVSAKGAEIKDQGPRWVRFQVLRGDPVINISVVEESKPDLILNVLVDYQLSDFNTWSDSDCRKFFVSLKDKTGEGPGIHAGARCVFDKDSVQIKIEASDDLRVPNDPIRISESQYHWFDPQVVKSIKLQAGGKSRELDVMLHPPRPKFRLHAAVAPTFSYYRETPATVTLSDVGLGAGVWARYSLGRFALELGGFVSFLQVVQISTETTKPIWIDSFGHLIYHTRWKLGSFGISLIAGASLVHMIVASNIFGVSATVGPEIGAEFHQYMRVFTPPRWRIQTRFGFFAFNPISIVATLNASLRINSVAAKLPLYLRAEGKFFTAGSSTVSNTATGLFTSLGLSADLI